MFWVLFAIVILVGCAISWLADLFQQMKNSEFEIIRVIYWVLVIATWISILIWIANW